MSPFLQQIISIISADATAVGVTIIIYLDECNFSFINWNVNNSIVRQN